MLKRYCLYWCLFLGSGFSIWAQNHSHNVDLSYYLPSDVTYDTNIPTPKDVLGYEVGDWHVSHDQLLMYMRAIAAASDRAIIKEHGFSYEQRPVIYLIFTSPENHNNLESLQEQHLQLTDPANSASLDVSGMPGVVQLGYTIHGNEPSGINAALLVAYYLAAAKGPKVEKQLDEMIVLLDPCYNPDGTNRFASWVNTHRGINLVSSDNDDREHIESWPGGRTNHYWFDLNRDWLLTQHPVSQARIQRFHEWKPNWLTDHHEMGTNATFFFQPGIPSRNYPRSPEKVFELTFEVAEYHASYLDSIGSLYFTREGFDDYYIGKGSTYPDVNGCIGILFEQASARGHRQDSDHGILEFPFAIRNQFVTSLSTLHGTHNIREDLLSFQKEFFSSAIELAASDPIKGIVFGSSKDKVKSWHMAQLISRHDIGLYPLDQSITVNGTEFSEGSYYIPLDQPQYRLIKAMFERRTEFEDSLFYDVSTWTFPLAFDLADAELTAADASNISYTEEWDPNEMPVGTVKKANNPYAYVFEWYGYYAPRALHKLLEAGVIAQVATDTFLLESYGTFYPGTVVVPAYQEGELKEGLADMMEELAEENGLDIYAVPTGFSENGVDLGSRSFEPIQSPKVLLLVGDGVSGYEAGEVWHLLDQRYHIPVTKIPVEYFSRADLEKYHTLVMVNGSYGRLTENQVDDIREWVTEGGNIVAWKGALRWLTTHNMVDLSYISPGRDSITGPQPYGRSSKDRGAQVIGGSIFEADVDLSHPLGYGLERSKISLFRNSTLLVEYPETSLYNFPLIYTDSPLLSGYISDENLEKLSGTAAGASFRVGGGRIICLTDNPNFRGYWYGTNRLFANALFFADAISN